MEIRIVIECDTINEFHSHLSELSKQVRSRARKQKLNPIEDEFKAEDADSLYDDNCYGTHQVEIISD